MYQDSEEDLPLGFYVTYEDGGPQYSVFDFDDQNRAEWHKDKAIELLEDQGYDALLDWATQEIDSSGEAYESIL